MKKLLFTMMLTCFSIVYSMQQPCTNEEVVVQLKKLAAIEAADFITQPGNLERYIKNPGLIDAISDDAQNLLTQELVSRAEFNEILCNFSLALQDSNITKTIQFTSNETLITVSYSTVKLWDLKTGQCLKTFEHDDCVKSVRFNYDNRYILIASHKTATLWDVQTGKWACMYNYDNYADKIQLSSNGKLILRMLHDRSARANVTSENWLNAKDKTRVEIWKVKSGKLLHAFNNDDYVNTAKFSPDGKLVVTGSYDNTAILWDMQTGDFLRTFHFGDDRVRSIQFSPDSKLVIISLLSGKAELWDLQASICLHTLNGVLVNSVQFSPDGKLVRIMLFQNGYNGADAIVMLWDVESRQYLHAFDHNDHVVNSAEFSSDNKFIVTTSNKKARVWDVQTGLCLQTFKHNSEVDSARFSPDGKFIVTISNKKARVWYIKPKTLKEALLLIFSYRNRIQAECYEPEQIQGKYPKLEQNLENVADSGNLVSPRWLCTLL